MASLLCHVLDRTLVWHRSIKTNKDTKLCLTSAANVCSEFPRNETLKVKLSLSNYGETKTERERRSESRRCKSGTGRLSLCVMMQLFSVFTIVECMLLKQREFIDISCRIFAKRKMFNFFNDKICLSCVQNPLCDWLPFLFPRTLFYQPEFIFIDLISLD